MLPFAYFMIRLILPFITLAVCCFISFEVLKNKSKYLDHINRYQILNLFLLAACIFRNVAVAHVVGVPIIVYLVSFLLTCVSIVWHLVLVKKLLTYKKRFKDKVVYCDKCGFALPPIVEFCTKCGNKIERNGDEV